MHTWARRAVEDAVDLVDILLSSSIPAEVGAHLPGRRYPPAERGARLLVNLSDGLSKIKTVKGLYM